MATEIHNLTLSQLAQAMGQTNRQIGQLRAGILRAFDVLPELFERHGLTTELTRAARVRYNLKPKRRRGVEWSHFVRLLCLSSREFHTCLKSSPRPRSQCCEKPHR